MPDDELPELPAGWLADPVPNDRAIEFIEGKTPMAASVFKGLLPELKARAIAVAGIESAGVARDVRAALAELPAGADWDKTRRKIADLVSPWTASEDDPKAKQARTRKAELILRTHGFQAYAVAQHEVMREEQDIFPFWQYLTMEDERVRATHSALDKLVFPAESPFWHHHSPPWDWGCRCRKVQLLPEEVEEIQAREKRLPPEKQTVIEGAALDMVERQNKLNRGPSQIVDITPPIEKGKPGAFSFQPDTLRLSPAELQGRYDPQTWAEFQTWAHKTEVEPGTTVWEWMGGKELPKPAPVAAARAAAPVAAPAAPTPRTMGGLMNDLEGKVPLYHQLVSERGALELAKETARARGDMQAAIQHASALAAKENEVQALLETAREACSIPQAERGVVKFTKLTTSTKQAAEAGAALAQRYTHSSLMPTLGVKYSSADRAFHRAGVIHINKTTSPSTVMHEITHGTEQQTPGVLQAALDFLKKRTAGEPLKTLRSLTGLKYKANEFAWEDQWKARGGNHYMGKTYGGRATELLTMGIERLDRDPMEFYLSDRDYFEFVLKTLQLL